MTVLWPEVLFYLTENEQGASTEKQAHVERERGASIFSGNE